MEGSMNAATFNPFKENEEMVIVETETEPSGPEEVWEMAKTNPAMIKAGQLGVVIDFAKSIAFAGASDVELGRDFINRGKEFIKAVQGHHRPGIKEKELAWKAAIADEKALIGPIEEANGIVSANMGAYFDAEHRWQEQERIRLEQQRQAEIKAKSEAARKRIEALMDDSSDTAGKMAALEAELEKDQTSTEEAEIIRTMLRTLQACEGNTAQAVAEVQAALEAEIAATPVTALAVEETKVKGVVKKKDYAVEVIDMVALCAAIGRGEVPPGVVKEAASVLKAHAKAMGGKQLPGCRVTISTSSHTRG